jgi:hypothetical protein
VTDQGTRASVVDATLLIKTYAVSKVFSILVKGFMSHAGWDMNAIHGWNMDLCFGVARMRYRFMPMHHTKGCVSELPHLCWLE